MPFPLDWLWAPHVEHHHADVTVHDAAAAWFLGGPGEHGLPVSLPSSVKASAFLQGPDPPGGVPAETIDMWHSSARHGSSFLFENSGLVDVIKATPPAAIVPLHAASIVVSLPGHIVFELGEGYLFGFQKGLELAFAGKALGALAAFGVGRSVGCCQDVRESMRDRMQSWPTALKAAKSVERGGHVSVFLVRIAPIPCVVKNYALSSAPFNKKQPRNISLRKAWQRQKEGGLILTQQEATVPWQKKSRQRTQQHGQRSGSGAAMKAVAAASTIGAVTFAGLLAAYCLHQVPDEETAEEAEKAQQAARPEEEQVETVKLFRPDG
eukprot:g7484.t1